MIRRKSPGRSQCQKNEGENQKTFDIVWLPELTKCYQREAERSDR